MKSPIPASWAVPEVFRERMGASAGRQRTMAADGHLLLVLHDVPDGPRRRAAQLFWRAPAGEWRSTAGAGIGALTAHVDAFAREVDRLEGLVEAAGSADEYFAAVKALAPLHRTAHHLHVTLQAAREARPDDRDLITLRDVAVEVERAAELVLGQAREGLGFTVAKMAEAEAASAAESAAQSHRLNVVAAMFLPITAISGLFGMNLPHGLAGTPALFWTVAAVALLAGLVVRAGARRQAAPSRRATSVEASSQRAISASRASVAAR